MCGVHTQLTTHPTPHKAESMDRYEVMEVIGRGAQGTASLVRCKSDQSLLVIKNVFISPMGVDERVRDRALGEALRLKSLPHPHIIQYVDHFVDGSLYIVIEYAEGGDLASLIKAQGDTPIPESTILRYIAQIGSALEHLHERHIIHRDVKSQNVFVMRNGDVKVGDLGLSIELSGSHGLANSVCGTPHYMAPEVCRGNTRYDMKADVWSLGVVMYELMARRLPFGGDQPGGGYPVMDSILYDDYPEMEHAYSDDLQHLLRACLTKDANARPDIFTLFKSEVLVNARVAAMKQRENELQTQLTALQLEHMNQQSEIASLRLTIVSLQRDKDEITSLRSEITSLRKQLQHRLSVSQVTESPTTPTLSDLQRLDVPVVAGRVATERHTDAIWCVAVVRVEYSYHLVSCSEDGTIKLWNTENGVRHVRTVKFGSPVWAMCAFGGDDGRVACGCGDGTVRVHHVKDGSSQCTLSGHRSWVQCVVWTGTLLVSGGDDQTIRFWDVDAGVLRRTIDDAHNCEVEFLLSPSPDVVVSGGYDDLIKVWRVSDGCHVSTLHGHDDVVWCMVMYGESLISGGVDGSIKEWDVARAQCVHTVDNAHHGKGVEALCTFGPYIVSSGYEHNVLQVWDVPTWTSVRRIEIPNFHTANSVTCLTSCGRMLVGGQRGDSDHPPSLLMWGVV